MSESNFAELLQTPMDSIKRPPPLPAGTYHGVITSHEMITSSQKKTPGVRYNVTLTAPGDDVDAAALDGIDLTKRSLRRDYWLTADASYRLKELLQSVGVSVEGRSLGECIPEARNAKVLVSITQRMEGKDTFNDIRDLNGDN